MLEIGIGSGLNLPFYSDQVKRVFGLDPSLELQEMARKPNGQFFFIEHGRSNDSGVMAWQDRLTPAWRFIAGGCHLNRKIDDIISKAGFPITDLNTFYMAGPRPLTYTYHGVTQVRGTEF